MTGGRGRPKLRFGVLSDIHIAKETQGDFRQFGYGSSSTFKVALEWFRDAGVDAVVAAGDLADHGWDSGLDIVSKVWYEVFPEDRAPDGRPVEKVFVYGNHDMGPYYGSGYARKWPDRADAIRLHAIRSDPGGCWKRAFHEDYARLSVKTVRGYAFFGGQWDYTQKGDPFAQIGEHLSAHGHELDPRLPFFYVQHPHLKDTCYGSWAWGHDKGAATAALSAYPNAIALSGHSHYTLTDERSIWQGAFTSVGTASTSYVGCPNDEWAPTGYENGSAVGPDAMRLNAAKLSPWDFQNQRECMLWSVYDDCLVIRRHDLTSGFDLGDDWVLPLPAAEARPFAFLEHARRTRVPRFAADARLKVVRAKAKTRGGNSGKDVCPSAEKDVLRVEIPAAVPDRNARLFDCEVIAETADGKKVVKRVMASGFSAPAEDPRVLRPTVCNFDLDELDAPIKVKVKPRNSFGLSGRTFVATFIEDAS